MQGYNIVAFFGVSLYPSGVVALSSEVYEYPCILQIQILWGARSYVASRRLNKYKFSYINLVYMPSV